MSCILFIEPGALEYINDNREICRIEAVAGDILLFWGGSLLHRGVPYLRPNVRIFCYVEGEIANVPILPRLKKNASHPNKTYTHLEYSNEVIKNCANTAVKSVVVLESSSMHRPTVFSVLGKRGRKKANVDELSIKNVSVSSATPPSLSEVIPLVTISEHDDMPLVLPAVSHNIVIANHVLSTVDESLFEHTFISSDETETLSVAPLATPFMSPSTTIATAGPSLSDLSSSSVFDTVVIVPEPFIKKNNGTIRKERKQKAKAAHVKTLLLAHAKRDLPRK